MILAVHELALGPFTIDTWVLLGRLPVVTALAWLTWRLAKRSGWHRAALGLSGFLAGALAGFATLPSILGAFAGGILVAALTLAAIGGRAPPATRVASALLGIVAVGRIACLLNGCCFGVSTNVPWAVVQPAGSYAAHVHATLGLVAHGGSSAPIHPVQGYDSIATFAIIAALPWLRRRLRSEGGAALAGGALFLVAYAACDSLRIAFNTSLSLRMLGPLSLFQWGTLAAALALAVAALRLSQHAGRETETAPEAPTAVGGIAPLAAAWILQVALASAALPSQTPFLAWLTVASLAASLALMLPRLLASPAGRPSRRRIAAALLVALLAPMAIRAAGAETAAPRVIYIAAELPPGAPTTGSAASTEPPFDPTPLPPIDLTPLPRINPRPLAPIDPTPLPPVDPKPVAPVNASPLLPVEPPSPPSIDAPPPPTIEQSLETVPRLAPLGTLDAPAGEPAVPIEPAAPFVPRTTVRVSYGSFSGSWDAKDDNPYSCVNTPGTTGSGCGGGTAATTTCYYGRMLNELRAGTAGISFERASASQPDVDGPRSTVWQLRASRQELSWERQYEQGGTVLDSASGGGVRWTAGGLYEWRRPRFSFGLGGLVGRDGATSGPFKTTFTKNGYVLLPGFYMRAGGRIVGVETGTMARHQSVEGPFVGAYLGNEETAILRLSAFSPMRTSPSGPMFLVPSLTGEVHAGSLWLSAGWVGRVSATATIGYDLP